MNSKNLRSGEINKGITEILELRRVPGSPNLHEYGTSDAIKSYLDLKGIVPVLEGSFVECGDGFWIRELFFEIGSRVFHRMWYEEKEPDKKNF